MLDGAAESVTPIYAALQPTSFPRKLPPNKRREQSDGHDPDLVANSHWYMDFDAVEHIHCLQAQSQRLAIPQRADPYHHAEAPRIEKRQKKNGESELSNSAQATAQAQQRSRRFSRYRFDARIQVAVFRDGLTTTCWGRTSELGQDGMGATLSSELQAGEVVSVEFPVPLPPHLLKVRAVVRYSDGLRCGFEFLVVTEQQRLLLRQVCVVLSNAS